MLRTRFEPAFLERLHAVPYPALGVRDGMVWACNAAAAELFGLSPDEPDYLFPVEDYLLSGSVSVFHTLMDSGCQAGRMQSEWLGRGYYVDIVNQNGQILMSFIPRRLMDGDHIPQFMMRLDSHVRGQLTPLLASLEQLASRADPADEKIARYLSEVRQSVFSLLRMSNNLRDTAKCLDRVDFFDPELCDLGALCRRTAVQAGLFAGFSGVRVLFSGPEAHLLAAADPDKIERILFNLLSNAIRHSPKGGTVRVYLARMDNSVVLRVRDEGSGMDEKSLTGIFEKYRSWGANALFPGLGLSLSAAYAGQHGGSVFLKSEAGGGTEVTVTFPYNIEGDFPIGTPPPDYTGEFPHFLVELSDLPGTASLYSRQADLDMLLEKNI